MGRSAKLKAHRKEIREAIKTMPFLGEFEKPKSYTKEQVDKMLTAAFKDGYEARNREMKKTVREEVSKTLDNLFLDCDYHVLYVLKHKYGFGEKRLHEFYNSFYAAHRELKDYYELEDASVFMPREVIEQMGIDLEAWKVEAEAKYG